MSTRAASNAAPRSAATGPKRRRRQHHRRVRRISRLLAWLLAGWLGTSGLSLAQVAPGALPTGGQVRVGSGQLTQTGNLLVIQQNTPRLGLDWQSFNIGSAATVEFRQPGASSIALNRVLGNNASEIYGQLKANGQVFLVNPNGVLFAPGARVDVGGLVASALDLSQQDFADGRFLFSATGTPGAVTNRGSLRAANGGYIALFGQQVSNEGEITVDSGSVVLGSGRAATVSISGSGLLSAVVAPGLLPGRVDNSGLIAADGGTVTLTAKSAQDIAASLVNNRGIVRADTIQERNGEIWITGDNVATSGTISASASGTGKAGRIGLLADLNTGHAQVGGTLRASSAGGEGGFVETSGARVDVAEGTRVDTRGTGGAAGTWLVDPVDFNIAPAGTPGGNISGQTLSTNLQTTNYVVNSNAGTGGTAGNVNVDDTVSWSSHQLTLSAQGDVNIRQPLAASGTASLALEYGQATAAGTGSRYVISGAGSVTLPSGSNLFSTKQGSGGATVQFNVVNTLAELAQADASSTTLGQNWALGSNIDAGNQSFTPIGNEASSTASNANSFRGVLDGVGHTISNLSINLASGVAVGLVGNANNATIRNLALSGSVAVTQTGSFTQYVGGVVGIASGTTALDHVSSTATVSTTATGSGVAVGGLVGQMGTGTITAGSFGSPGTPVTLTGGYYVGGLVGNGGSGAISASSSYASISGTGVYVGGLAGRTGGAVDGSSSGGTVQTSGNAWIGGLIGRAEGTGAITNSSSSANVSTSNGGSYAGGLIGGAYGGSVTGASATGTVSGTARVGGLIGDFSPSAGSTLRGTAGGNVSGTGDVGGLVGYAAGNATITNSSATGNVSSSTSTSGSVGGLVGSYNLSGAQTGNSAAGTLSGGGSTGGLIGFYNSTAAITDGSYTGPAIVGGVWVGGLIGFMNQAAAITGPSQANPWTLSIDVTATASGGGAGGFVGRSSGTMTNLRATGNVSGTWNVGGLVGYATGTGSITNSSATGNVSSTITSNGSVGGLVGAYELSGAQTGNTASGTLTRGNVTGGLIGWYNSPAPITDGTYTGASVTGGQWVGGLIGYMNQAAAITGPSPANPWVIATDVTATVGNGAAGGFVGRSMGTMANLRATGNISGNFNVGGLVGYATGAGSISNSSATGNVTSSITSNGSVGGLAGAYELTGAQTGNSASGTLSGGNVTGGLIGWYNSPAAITDGSYAGASVTGGQWVGGLVGYMNQAASISGASPGSPWVIGTNVTATVANGGAGVFAGRSFGSLANLRATGTVTGAANSSVGGVSGQATGATGTTMSSLTATGDVSAGANSNVGGLIGFATGTGTLSASTATGRVTAPSINDSSVGGLVGNYNLSGALSGGSAGGVISGGFNVGGLVGYYNSPATLADGSYGQASITGGSFVGGLIGQMAQGSIVGPTSGTPWVVATQVTATGTSSFPAAGGVVGLSVGTVANISATGNVQGNYDVGGLVGRANGTGAITNTSASGNVTSTTTAQASVGGLVGAYNLSGSQSGNTASGTLTGGSATGGLIGYYNTTAPFTSGTYTGASIVGGAWVGGLIGYMNQAASVSGTSPASPWVIGTNVQATVTGGAAGGFVGRSLGPLANLKSTGTVQGVQDAGGIVGRAEGSGTASALTATGNVSATGSNGGVGGVVGSYNLSGAITGASAGGSVSGGAYAGGLVGYYNSPATVSDGSFTGASVSGGSWAGGLIGYMVQAAAIAGPSAQNPLAVGADVTTTAAGGAGGLVGRSFGPVSNARATGNVTGAGGNVGGLVGQADGSGGFSNVSAAGAVQSTAASANVGGLVGLYNNSGAFSGTVTASGNVSGGSETGGLVGYYNSNATIDGVTATGSVTVTGTGDAGGLIGLATGTGQLKNSSASGNVSAAPNSDTVGGLVGQFQMTGGISNVSAGSAASGNTPATSVSGGNYTGGVIGWTNNGATTGFVTDANAGVQFVFLGSAVSGSNWVGGLVGASVGSAGFSGLSSSASVTTSRLSTSGAGGIAGNVAGAVSNSTASGNVSATGAGTGTLYIGGLVGQADSGASFTDVSASGTVSSTDGNASVGGLVGYATQVPILRATATGAVSGGSNTGGLVGQFFNATLTNGRAEGNVSGSTNVGGLVGNAAGTGGIVDGRALGVVSSDTNSGSVGGLVGSYTMGSGLLRGRADGALVSGGANTGGLVGYYSTNGTLDTGIANAATVSGSGNVGGMVGSANTLTSSGGTTAASVVGGNYAGGFVGYASGSGTIGSLTLATDVSGSNFVGGVAGWLDGYTISGVHASGRVVGIGDTIYAGGLAGNFGYFSSANQSITNSTASGRVFVDARFASVGGLVGRQYAGSITGSTASGAVVLQDSTNGNSSSRYAGGLAGEYYGTGITGSHATGAVSGGYYTGGLVGSFAVSNANIAQSDATGPVSGGQVVGGLVGTYYGAGVVESSATGSVTASGTGYVGGLIGDAQFTSAGSTLFASGNVTATNTNGTAAGGLIGHLSGYGLTSASASGKVTAGQNFSFAGGLIGLFQSSTSGVAGAAISAAVATGDVVGGSNAGGLVGNFSASTYGGILSSQASGNVSGSTYAGGLVGQYSGGAVTSQGIVASTAGGNVAGGIYAGGLVGYYSSPKGISGSAATGAVTNRGVNASTYLGGLVGYYNFSSTTGATALSGSYATGNVGVAGGFTLSTGAFLYAGGLVGYLDSGARTNLAASDVYASGAVSLNNATGQLRAGGLVGFANASVARGFANGSVAATNGTSRITGGLLGALNSGVTVTDSFWNTETTGQAGSAGGLGSGLTTAQTLQAASFTNWNINTSGSGGKTWRIYEGLSTPLLSSFLTPLTLTLADASKVYDGTTSFGNASIVAASGPVTHPERIFSSAPSADVGTYAIGAAGVYSVQNGYDLTVAGSANLTVTPRPLTLAGIVASKTYDGTRNATLVGTAQPAGLVAGEDLLVATGNVTALFDTKNVGTGKTVTISGYTVADGLRGKASNYSLANATSTTANITPATLSAGSFSATNRTYNGSTLVAVSAASSTLTGVFGQDDVSVDLSSVTSGLMADKNAGSNKPVTVLGASLTGNDAANYRIGGIDNVTVDIAPRALTVNSLVARDRSYNAQTAVSIDTSSGVVSGVLGNDSVQLVSTTISNGGQMADKNVGSNKPVTVTGTLQLRGADAPNYTAQAAPTTVNITPATVYLYGTRTGTSDRVYDGTTNASLNVQLLNAYNGDNVVLGYDAPHFADKNVAFNNQGAPTNKAILVTNAALTGTDAANYTLDTTAYAYLRFGTITPKPLTVTGVAALNRAYDGTRNVTVNVSGASVDTSAVVQGDDVTPALPSSGTVVGTMADKNVGTNKAVTVPGFTLTGADQANYTLTGSNGVTVDITKKDLLASYTGRDRSYDGRTWAGVVSSSGDIVGGDDVRFYANEYVFYYTNFPGSYTAPAVFTDSKNVGSDKPVRVTYDYLIGNDASNYNYLNPTLQGGYGTTTANLTPKSISLFYAGSNKVYDGSTSATVTLNRGNSGIFGSDDVSATQTAAFADPGGKNVGNGKTIAISGIAISGADAANYSLASTTASATANITAKPVTFTGISAVNRDYDGTTNVAVNASGVTSAGFVPGDDVSVQQPQGGLTSGTIANKNVGTGKTVTVTGLSLAGTAAGNYSIDASGSGITVDITPRPLTVSYTGVNRPYNGGVAAQVTPSSADLVGGDNIAFSQNAVFTGLDAKNAGTNKPISVSGITISGTDRANYALQNTTATAFADITSRPLTVSYTGVSRVYNGLADTSISVLGSTTDLVPGDLISFTQSAQLHVDGSAGSGKQVDVTGISIAGPQAANYTLTATTATTTATITPRPITVTGITAVDRAYDGTRSVAINVGNASVNTAAVIAADVGNVSVVLPPSGISTGTMADKNVGQNKDVQVTGLSITGSAASNYTLGGASGLTVNITPRQINALFAAASKVYDGNAVAQVTGSSADIVPGDLGALGISATGAFVGGKNVGTGKAVAVSGAFLTGAERNNYALANTGGSASADITPKDITPSYSGGTRVYDGGSAAPVTSTTTGFIAGDAVALAQTAQFRDGKAVGNGKAIDVSSIALLGADALNYHLSAQTATATGSITPKPILVSGLNAVTAQDRIYDGTNSVQVTIPSNVTLVANSADIVQGDQVSISVPPSGTTTGTMADKNVGSAKQVVITGLNLSGNDAGNYVVAGAAGVTVNIAKKPLTASYGGVTRVYDGGSSVRVAGSSSDIVGGDAVTISGDGLFVGTGAKNVGTGKDIQVTSASLSGGDAVNYSLVNPTGSAFGDVTVKFVTPSYAPISRVYDGTTAAPVVASRSALVSGDDVSFSQTASFIGAGAKNVGSGKAISVTGITLSGTDAANYALTASTAATTGSITPRPITLTGLTGVQAVDRAYDGTTNITVNVTTTGPVAPTPGDIIGSDVVVINVPPSGPTSGTIADKNAGNAKAVVSIAGLGLSGADAANYSLVGASGLTVDITPRLLTAVYTGQSKVYDGQATAPVTATSAAIVPGDSLTITPTARFDAGKNVGTGLAISVTQATLAGNDRFNYTLLNPTGSTTGSITPKPVSVSYAGGASRVYDGSVNAPVLGSISGLVTGDSVSFAQTAVFTDGKNVGTDKPVAITGIGLSGTDAANYALTATSAGSTASVTPKPLRIDGLAGITATDRVYDGTTSVQVTIGTTGTVTPNSQDLVPGDVVGVNLPGAGSATGTMADKNVGTAKTVSVPGFGLTGADAGNYTVAAGSGITVNITPRPLTAVYGGVTRVYDGTTDVVVSGTSTDILGTDQVTIGGAGRYSGAGAKNAGSNKPLDVTGGTLSGVDRTNYSLVNPTGTATGTVLQRSVTALFSGGTKVYDGSTAAPVSGSASGFIANDDVRLAATAVFTDADAKGVGTNKPVSISAISLSGADAVNYSLLTTSASTTASVTPKLLGVNGLSGITATDRVYDGTNRVSLTVQSTGPLSPVSADVVPGDDVSVALPSGGISAGTMADRNVGQNKAVTVAGLVLGGADAHNYQVAAASGVTVNIAPRPVTASYVALDKVYDGTALAQVGGLSADLIGGDLVTITGSGSFTGGKNVGTGKTVQVSGGALQGADSANYALLNPAGTATASITPRILQVSYTGGSKVYDGLANAPVTPGALDVVANDDLRLDQAAVFTGAGAKNVGSGKAVSISGISLAGADSANYQLANTTASTTASITPRPVNVSGLGNISAVDRVYDGTRNVQIVVGSLNGSATGDFLSGDDVQVFVPSGGLGSGLMVDKNAGANKSVAVSGLSLTGSDAANYQITGTAGVSVNIAPRPVTLAGLSAIDRIYDGSTLVGLNTSGGSIAGVLGGDDLQLLATGLSGTMADKHVGSGKAVTVSGLRLGGADAGNYLASSTQTLSVNIAPRPFTATITAQDKVYDGTTAATATLATSGLVQGDDVALASGVTVAFADKNAGTGKTVTATGLALAGADAADYLLSSGTATTTANIAKAPLSIRYAGGPNGSNTLTKVYGEAVDLGTGAFTATGLVGQERVGQVDIASAGAAAGADAGTTPYAVTLANARGGSFDPANYSLSYAAGGLLVTPRPVYLSGNIFVLYTTDIQQSLYDGLNAPGVGWRLLPGGLINGDALRSVVLGIEPARPADVTGGSVVTLSPSAATLAAGAKAGNYSFNYANGAIIVLPSPPRVGDLSAGSGTSTSEFNLADPRALEIAQQAEAVQARLVAELKRLLESPRSGRAGPAAAGGEARPEDLAALLAADPQRVNPALLKRVPLLSVDPQLRQAPAAAETR